MKKSLSLLFITLMLGFVGTVNAYSLSYSYDVDVSFTFNPTISMSISSPDLLIYDLAPGSAADSNNIRVGVSTNTAYGYVLSATVGQETNYETRNLILSGSAANFASLAFGSSVASITTDNTWGFSYKPSGSGSSWTNYSGLPLYSDSNNVATLISSDNAAASDYVDFKIGAKASSAQPIGEYKNVINFILVANPEPSLCNPAGTTITTIGCMQDISSTNKSSILASMAQGTAYLLYDSRDEQQYHVAKLADGNIWMLDNLALDPTDPTTVANMNASNTNASAEAITNLLNGGNAGSNAGWSSTAVADVDSGFNSYTAPMINNASKDTVVTSYGAGSGKVGIYYNYCAASASTYCYALGQGVDVPNTDIDAPQDICPANWRMPTGGNYDDSNQTGSGEYYALGTALGLIFDEDEWGFTGTTYQTALSTPLSGYYSSSSAGDQGNWGYWWSSTYSDRNGMYSLDADSSYVNPALNYGRYSGFTMRCLVGS
ncbi:hypothetical protein IKF32_02185 [Candidatus Saccharibacteria bacterium]|nr:hypothetical protein [Candidatus Saccharibacteria bacterium]